MKVLLMGEWRQIAGSSEITLESHPRTIRKLLNAMEEKYPCGKWGTAMVALNHTMYAGDWSRVIKEDEKVCIMPMIEGG